jgi:RNA polymerase sigma-70 factor (ECF subfamily)
MELIEELYRSYRDFFLKIAKQNMPEVDAEDVVQDVFLHLMESPDWLAKCMLKSNETDELSRILHAFLRNACNNWYKHSNIKHEIFSDTSDDELYKILDMEMEMEQKYHSEELFEHIINTLHKLDGHSKDIFIKYYIEGYSIGELAEQTGLSKRSIETYIYRTLKYLRTNLNFFKVFVVFFAVRLFILI